MRNPYYRGTGIGLALSEEIVNLPSRQSKYLRSRKGAGGCFGKLLLEKDHYRQVWK